MEEKKDLASRIKSVPNCVLQQTKQGVGACVETGALQILAPYVWQTVNRLTATPEETKESIGTLIGERSGSIIACASWVLGVSYYFDWLKASSLYVAIPVVTNLASYLYEKRKRNE